MRATVLSRRLTPSPSWIADLSTPARYAVALVLVAASTAGAELLDRLTHSHRVGGPFLVGVLVTSYLAGSGPGYLAASRLVPDLQLLRGQDEPSFSLASYTPEDVLVLLTFPTVAFLMEQPDRAGLRDEAKRSRRRGRWRLRCCSRGRGEFSASDDAWG